MGGIKAYHGRYGDRTLEDIVFYLKTAIMDEDLYASGKMYNSIYIQDGEVVIDVPYFPYMEYGTHPNCFVPLVKLIDWAKVKFGMDRREAYVFAIRVKRKICERGIRGRHFVERALSDWFDIRAVAREGDAIVYKVVRR